MDFINFHLMPGIILGSIYALGAIGISMTFGILRFANFAQGEIVAPPSRPR
jgi:branched-subunit amino acid ABC-type transport system permease component